MILPTKAVDNLLIKLLTDL